MQWTLRSFSIILHNDDKSLQKFMFARFLHLSDEAWERSRNVSEKNFNNVSCFPTFRRHCGVHKNRKNWMAAIFFLSVSTRNRFIFLSNVSTLSRRNYYLHKFRRKTITTVGWKNYSISFFLKFQCKKSRGRGATSNICGRLAQREQTEFEGKLMRNVTSCYKFSIVPH